ncbi:hypothetical protein N7492_000783 [Penicillium capsulatum]|uniref:Uncharacterized protein n=1 Tax=Penicillium capsulatum TaxID=69766 RepID=A0A9W9ISE8_9EURO|nr:hypothetical protein N7492_000783 [Penicillium capsulatum]
MVSGFLPRRVPKDGVEIAGYYIPVGLAYLMLYSILAVQFSCFEMELFETTEKDVEIVDQFAPVLRGVVKVKITKDPWADSNLSDV